METIFSLPGVDSRMVEAIQNGDYPVVQGFAVVIAIIFVFTNLLVDDRMLIWIHAFG